ncbi:MAG: DUF3500 domain-containing protein [Pirellulales bacterium]
MTRCTRFVVALAVTTAVAAAAMTSHQLQAAFRRPEVAESMARSAIDWLATLDADARSRAVRAFTDASRTGWHFIPKNDRKGVQLRDMTGPQEKAALAVLRSALSRAGYDKSLAIMQLDEILRRLEGDRAKNVRDPKRYSFTIFGTPSDEGSWGLSVEGHHLSLNFTVRDGKLVDSTPQFMGANPAEVKTTFEGLPPAGERVLRDEESLAFELIRSLDDARRGKAVIAAEASKEIRAAGEQQPPKDPSAGIAFVELEPAQQSVLRRLVETYCGSMPDEVAAERLRLIEARSPPGAANGESVHHGWDDIHFAWSGSVEPGIGHAYRVEGPTFAIEFVNVQPDAEGNPANHIHCVWRDRTGDFDLATE